MPVSSSTFWRVRAVSRRGISAPETLLNKLIEEDLAGWRGRVDPLIQDNESDPLGLDSPAGIEPKYGPSKLRG